METKKPTTFHEQMELLRSKGFIVSDENRCISFLQKANYYRLSAYLLPFRKKDKTYIQGIPFEQIQSMYAFDQRVRSVLFSIIEDIELYLRTQFAYYHSHKYGSLGYLDKENYSDKHNHATFLSKVQAVINENKNTLVVQHHNQNYDGKLPLWAAIEFFSAGMLSRFYSDLPLPDQKAIAKNLYSTAPPFLNSWLACFTQLRNRCAHYSRLYFWKFTALPKMPKGTHPAGQKLFFQLIALKQLYPDACRWNTSYLPNLQAVIEEYSSKNGIFLSHIDFPPDWEELLYKK